jgi:hypothetical protein
LENEAARLTTLGRRDLQHRTHLRKNGADAGRDSGHYRSGGNCNETSHQCVFDEILAASLAPYVKSKYKSHLSSLSAAFTNCCSLQAQGEHKRAGPKTGQERVASAGRCYKLNQFKPKVERISRFNAAENLPEGEIAVQM